MPEVAPAHHHIESFDQSKGFLRRLLARLDLEDFPHDPREVWKLFLRRRPPERGDMPSGRDGFGMARPGGLSPAPHEGVELARREPPERGGLKPFLRRQLHRFEDCQGAGLAAA